MQRRAAPTDIGAAFLFCLYKLSNHTNMPSEVMTAIAMMMCDALIVISIAVSARGFAYE